MAPRAAARVRHCIPFTADEDDWLRQGLAEYGRQWAVILRAFPFRDERTSAQLSRRYRTLASRSADASVHLPQHGPGKRPWSAVEEKTLRAAVRRYGAEFDVISRQCRELKHRSEHNLREKWKRMTEMESAEREVRRFLVLGIVDESGKPMLVEGRKAAIAARKPARLGYELIRMKELGTNMIHVFRGMRHANPKGTKDVKVLKMGCEYECDPDVMEVEDLIHEEERRRDSRKARRRTRLPVTYSAGMEDVKPQAKRRKVAQQVADDNVDGPAQGSRRAKRSESEATANGDDDVATDPEPVPPLKHLGRDELVSGTAKTISDDDASSLDREAPAGDRHVAVTGCDDALYKGDASDGQDDDDDDADDVAHSKSAGGCDEDVCEDSASDDDGSEVDLGERNDNADGDASDDDGGEVDRGECQGNASSDERDDDGADRESTGADRHCQDDDVPSARDDDGDDVDLETDELSMSGQRSPPEKDGVAKVAGDGPDRVGGRDDGSQSSSDSDIDIDRTVSATHQAGAIDWEDGGPPDEGGIDSDDGDHVQEGLRAADLTDDDGDTNARDGMCEASDEAGRAWSRLKAALAGHSLSPEDPIRVAPSTDTSSKVDQVDPAGDAPLSKSDRRRLREERRKRKEERARIREERRRATS